MTTWEILAIAGIVLITLEVLTPTFYFLPMGMALFATSFAASKTDSWVIITGVFAVSSFLSFMVFTRTLKKYHQKASTLTNVEGMVGKEVLVTEEITANGGYVKLYGDSWKALSLNGTNFSKGEKVVIVDMDGNKVTVDAIN